MSLLAVRIFLTLAAVWTQFRLGPENNAVLPGMLHADWRIETGGQISASPTVADATLYVGNNNGSLYAIDVNTGKTLWKAHVPNPLMSAPLIYDDLVIVGEGDPTSRTSSPSEPVMVGQGPSALIGFDRYGGSVRWQTMLTGSAMPTPAIIDGILVNHDGAGWVNGLNPATGERRYAHWIGSMASMSAILPVGDGDFVTTGVGSNAAWRMHADGGSVVWRSQFFRGASGIGDCPPVGNGERVFCDYVAPVSPDAFTVIGNLTVERVYALDTRTGARLWDVALESGSLPIRNEAAIPLLDNGRLYLGSSITPWMHALDASTGMLVWETPTHGVVKGGAVAVDGVIYFGDLGGYLWALDAKTGRVVGSKYMHAAFNVGSPIVVGKTLIVGSDTGSVIAVPLEEIRAAHDS
ncbi:MAG TPA: PQQ-binding-like beta-propeller repeat protein [Candidatus Cybelea sp.]|jgi:outer membrane protein assembly factor BamB|nr:PQQ-binding-like beta-propeller repeat protein [Candidatus Cybelea sp.]